MKERYRHVNRDTKIILLGTVAGLLGALFFVVGSVLQINLMGHGPFTATNRIGFAMMCAGPVLAALGGFVTFRMT